MQDRVCPCKPLLIIFGHGSRICRFFLGCTHVQAAPGFLQLAFIINLSQHAVDFGKRLLGIPDPQPFSCLFLYAPFLS
jgi:hypothetical protein